MLRSGKNYKMSEVTELLKVRMEESKKQEERREEERQRYEEERKRAEERYQEELQRRDEAEKRREEERQREREDDRQRYEELIRGVTEAKNKKEFGLEALKLTKLGELEDVEAFLTAFERAVEAHNVEPTQWAALLAPQLTGKALQAYAAMSNEEAKDYGVVKEAIFRRYDINEETYQRRLRTVSWKKNESPMEMLTRITDLTEKWLKSRDTREKVIDTIVKEQFINILPEETKVWVKERKPTTSVEAGKLAEDLPKLGRKAGNLERRQEVIQEIAGDVTSVGRLAIWRRIVTKGETVMGTRRTQKWEKRSQLFVSNARIEVT